ncbi:MAG TPA: dihydrodipicolinate reductase C-terminal domain-containing protein [Sedimentibacter sp.]|jgi:4-hydroxy-tetrahydrodipicolinate reductase|nr:dihydrodipicolinate reductase C-terminal domain-containing protein [Sedimentibacter sp.]HOT21985.1 dihydrodipicolinate reductase C-terminal domain-containing protein [Sedimentibacter sp.]HPB80214.1 dihydrodipicolinate reductase C-terminal domain-containing protein [Sedimentibacter sp.]HPV85285.1 dihydrodipicolinate reductase C-terminal domain-containing protein [Sedimentibacter sp.]HPY55750.1 dihydrodipicolinate reductase C-terminal domain-containing protein [Sedimentibacter sp.]
MNVVICGINGAMGRVLQEEIKTYDNINLIGSLSPRSGRFGQDIDGMPDVVIDFSNTANIDFLIEYATKNKCALLICTTGFSDEDKAKIKEAGKAIPVLLSSNTSLGINVFRKILKSISAELSTFDINIVEKHHTKKIDAPSGTAKTLSEDIKNATGREHVEISAIRAGTIPGEHTVIFSGVDEILEIKHTAFSKKIFARGAINLAMKLSSKSPGYYLMEDFF